MRFINDYATEQAPIVEVLESTHQLVARTHLQHATDVTKWQSVKEQFETTSETHGTTLQITPYYTPPPSQVETDAMKRKFMYKVMQVTLKVGHAVNLLISKDNPKKLVIR